MYDGLEEDLGQFGFSPVPPAVLRKNALRGIIAPPLTPQQSLAPQAPTPQSFNPQIQQLQDQAANYQQQGIALMAQKPDVSAFQRYAKQRAGQGADDAVMAMAAQRAGMKDIGQSLFKRSLEAQNPITAGKDGMVTPEGDFMEDPVAHKEQRINMLLSTATKYDQMAQRAVDFQQRQQATIQANALREQARQDGLAIRQGMLAVAQGSLATRQAAGEATLPQQTLDMMADQYLAGDRTVLQNLGRGMQGASNLVALRAAIQNSAQRKGMSGPQIAQTIAEFEGVKSGERAAGTRGAQLSIAGEAADKGADLVIEASAQVPRTKWVPVNRALISARSNTGDPSVVAFGAAVNSFVNMYARAISPTGQPSISDKDHARDMLQTAHSHDQVISIVNQLKKEVQVERNALHTSRDERRGNSSTGAAPASAGGIKFLGFE